MPLLEEKMLCVRFESGKLQCVSAGLINLSVDLIVTIEHYYKCAIVGLQSFNRGDVAA